MNILFNSGLVSSIPPIHGKFVYSSRTPKWLVTIFRGQLHKSKLKKNLEYFRESSFNIAGREDLENGSLKF